MARSLLPARRRLAPLAALLLALPWMAGQAAESRPAQPLSPVADAEPPLADIAPLRLLAEAAQRPAAAKLDAALTARLTVVADERPGLVVVRSAARLDLAGYGRVLRQWRWPAGEELAILDASPAMAERLAERPDVASVESGEPGSARPTMDGPDPDVAQAYVPIDGPSARARLDAAPDWRETEARLARRDAAEEAERLRDMAGPGAGRPAGWFDVGKGHAAREAWGEGFTGEGVRVAVIDTSVDFAHYDLQGTWATLPAGHPYAGWPQTYDPYSSYLYTVDSANADNASWVRNSRTAVGGLIEVYQQLPVVQREVDGQMADTACVRPLAQTRNAQNQVVKQLLAENCDTKVPASLSGQVRYGHHPDSLLARYGANPDQSIFLQYAGVLLVDANEAGRYDTVYVDLDYDNDFTDEKPVTRDSPVAWRDVDGDTIADISGGLLYFIADGRRSIPGAYLWEDADDPLPVPAAGSYVGFHFDVGGHGTLCASNVVSQGRLGVPAGRNVRWRNQEHDPSLKADGSPEAVNPGMAPRAKMVAIGDYYNNPQLVADTSWRYGVFGDDPDRTDEDIQITSNSYGYSNEDNDHWDRNGRFIDYYVRTFNPSVTFMKATGNGAPGYGTTTTPSPHTAMAVAASAQLGSTGWDSAYETSQITYGDIISWSDRGPGADGSNGVSVAADGAYAAGGNPINLNGTNKALAEELRSGTFANSTWGGTSRSTPVAAGLLALSYQAFRQTHGRWPTWEEARAIFMAGARFAGYDTLVQGAGVADGADSARLAAGKNGLYVLPSAWTPGDYHGQRAEAFAKLTAPGERYPATFSVHNPTDQPITAAVSGQTLRRVGSYSLDWASRDKAGEAPYTSMQSPDYLWPIDKSKVPVGTDLMVVRAVTPLAELDQYPDDKAPDGQYFADNCWRLAVYQHTDWNDDQKLWTDVDNDGIVDHVDADPHQSVGLDDNPAVDYAKSEIQEGEYQRFSYTTAITNNWEIPIHHPLERWKNGIHVALFHRAVPSAGTGGTHCRQRPDSLPISHFRFQVDFYRYQDWDWLRPEASSVTVPAHGEASLGAALAVPAGTATGLYQGALFLDFNRTAGDLPVPTGGGYEPAVKRLTVPVTVDVAARYDWSGSITLGGSGGRDADARYDNGAVHGTFDWGWRAESGDWRFYFVDAPEPPMAGTYWLFRSLWPEATPGKSDIDTRVFRLTSDRFSDPNDPQNASDNWADPSWYGPGTMSLLARSPYRNLGAGRWAFDTSSGVNEDWVAAAGASGLHEVMLHNMLFSGATIDLPFETTVSSLRLNPPAPTVYRAACTTARLTSQMTLPGFRARVYGFSQPDRLLAQPIGQDDATMPASAAFKKSYDFKNEIGRFQVSLTGKAGNDIDLYVMYDANKDGQFAYPAERVGFANNAAVNKVVTLAGYPAAGQYQVWVHGANVPAATTFDLTVDVVSGASLVVSGMPGEVLAGQTYPLRLCADPAAAAGWTGPMTGLVVLGPAGAPNLITWPIAWSAEAPPAPPNLYLPWLERQVSESVLGRLDGQR